MSSIPPNPPYQPGMIPAPAPVVAAPVRSLSLTDLIVTLTYGFSLVLALLFLYHRYIAPAPVVVPTVPTIEITAKAYLQDLPVALRKVEADFKSGKVTADGLGDAIGAEHMAAATAFATAIKAESSLDVGLEKAAVAIEGALKK